MAAPITDHVYSPRKYHAESHGDERAASLSTTPFPSNQNGGELDETDPSTSMPVNRGKKRGEVAAEKEHARALKCRKTASSLQTAKKGWEETLQVTAWITEQGFGGEAEELEGKARQVLQEGRACNAKLQTRLAEASSLADEIATAAVAAAGEHEPQHEDTSREIKRLRAELKSTKLDSKAKIRAAKSEGRHTAEKEREELMAAAVAEERKLERRNATELEGERDALKQELRGSRSNVSELEGKLATSQLEVRRLDDDILAKEMKQRRHLEIVLQNPELCRQLQLLTDALAEADSDEEEGGNNACIFID